jgi:hypothetical protein
VKTAVSVPDDVFRRAEKLAKTRKISRSQLYTAALVNLLELHNSEAEGITSAYDSAFGDARDESFAGDAGRRALLEVEWNDE